MPSQEQRITRPFAQEIDDLIQSGADFNSCVPEDLMSKSLYAIFTAPEADAHRQNMSFLKFLVEAQRLSFSGPSGDELHRAPLISPFSIALIDGIPVLIGIVEGHPNLRAGARVRTSALFQLCVDAGWARTWNRFYRLGRFDPGFFINCVSERTLSLS